MSKLTSLIICASLAMPGQSASAQMPKMLQSSIIHSQSNITGSFVPFVSFGVGTPPQKLTAILDTGSSDLVVPQTGSQICQNSQQQCSGTPFVTGSFDPSKSSGITNLNMKVNASFVNGVSLVGQFVKAPLTIGNQTTPNTQLGVIDSGFLPPMTPLFPIFGVGPISGEAPGKLYSNVPAHLTETGEINDNAFSVYLNDFRGPDGSLIFGGMDTAKFTGQLQSAPILTDNSGQKPSFVIQFSSLGLSNGNLSSSKSAIDLTPRDGLPPSLIDSGNAGIQIPAAAIQSLAKAIGTRFDQQNGLGNVPCNLGANGQSLAFGFNNDKIKINVPLDAMVDRDSSSDSTQCFLPIDPSQDIASLGAPFMQGAYVVFDMDNQRLWMAQAKINATESNVQPFTS